jgi:hypothetical protein
MKTGFAIILALHGLVHLAGFAKAWGWQRAPLSTSISRPLGLVWLAAGGLFFFAAVLLLLGVRVYWLPGVLALLLSQVLIATAFAEAKWGSLVNVVLLLPLTISLASDLRDRAGTSFAASYAVESRQRLARARLSSAVLTPEDLNPLPTAVRRYLEVSGVVGKPRVTSFRATLRGRIRPSPTSGWLDFEAEQHNFVAERTRLFLMHARQWGVPFEVWHRYADGRASMQVRLASLIDLMDARGPEMNQGETVTLFNDMCLLAPATLIEPGTRFREIDAHRVAAEFTHAGNSVHAVLSFAEDGTLANFQSDDRYLSSDGKSYAKYRWSTPVLAYRELGGRRIPWRARASWAMPEGEFTYVELEVVNVEYGPTL